MGRAPSMPRDWITTRGPPIRRTAATRACFPRPASRARSKIRIGSSLRSQATLSRTRPSPLQRVTKTTRGSTCRTARRRVRADRKSPPLIRSRRNWLHRLLRTTFCPCSKATTRNSSSRSTTKCKESVPRLGGNSSRPSLGK